MQSDIDAQLTNFFEEAPPREFATVMRGYDRHQVDEHIRQIETEVRQHREQTQGLRQQLTDAHRQIQEQERPTYSGLGARIEQLLRLAEEQATELVQAARSEANEIKAAAKVDAAEFRAAAENEATELRANAKRETDDLRGAAEREADSIRTSASRSRRTPGSTARTRCPGFMIAGSVRLRVRVVSKYLTGDCCSRGLASGSTRSTRPVSKPGSTVWAGRHPTRLRLHPGLPSRK